MTIINPKSIAGVTSITTASGADNLLTVHTNNTTERIRINNDGDVIVGSGITVSPDGDIFATGVTTSTTFVGGLTGNVTGNISGGTVAGSTGTFSDAVTIVKSSGPLLELTTNTSAADATLRLSEGATGSTSNGGGIFYSGADNKLHITCGTNSTTKRITINRDDGLVGIGSDAPTHNLDIHASGNPYLKLLRSGYNPVYIGNAAGEGVIETTGATFFKTGGSERARIDSDGDFGLGTTSPAYTNALFGGTQRTLHVSGTAAPMVRVQSSTSGQADLLLQSGNSVADAYIANAASNGDLVFSTNNGSSQGTRLRILDDGGICFNSDTAAANALDDYEEGTWSPTYKVGSGSSYTMSAATYTSSNTGGTYQKIGRLVTFSLRIQCSSFTINNGAQVTIIGLPFTSTNTGDTGSQHGATFSYAQAICNSNNGYIPQLHIPNNNTEIDFYTCNGNTYQTGDGNNNFGNTLHIHGQYITDA